MKSNNFNIARAIKRATGVAHVRVQRIEGLCYFDSTDRKTLDFILDLDASPIYVNRISHLSVANWVEEFKAAIKAGPNEQGE
jgi:hypothetical protein